jgi:thiol:disulfide interchange protein
MRPVLAIGIIVFGVAAAVAVSDWREAHAKEIIPWRADLSAAMAEGRQTHHRVFAYFTSRTCPPCQRMKSTTWADNVVLEAMGKYVPVKIDVDANPALSEEYGVTAMPSYVILSEDGEAQRRYTGMMFPEEMVRWLEK